MSDYEEQFDRMPTQIVNSLEQVTKAKSHITPRIWYTNTMRLWQPEAVKMGWLEEHHQAPTGMTMAMMDCSDSHQK